MYKWKDRYGNDKLDIKYIKLYILWKDRKA